MNENLINKLMKAYPEGVIHARDDNALVSEERDERIRSVLRNITSELSLNVMVDVFDKPNYSLAMTEGNTPHFEEWLWRMGNPDKLTWISSNGDRPYVVLWLKISRVADYYSFYFNHWVPRGDTGYLDADCRREPSQAWSGYTQRISDWLGDQGFLLFTSELAKERTPFIQEHDYDSIPEDDPRWDEDDFEPPLVPAYLGECLFGH